MVYGRASQEIDNRLGSGMAFWGVGSSQNWNIGIWSQESFLVDKTVQDTWQGVVISEFMAGYHITFQHDASFYALL